MFLIFRNRDLSMLRGFLRDFLFVNEKQFYFSTHLEGTMVLLFVSLMKKLIVLQSKNALTALEFFCFSQNCDGFFLRASLGN